ncbi:hypothetical protein DRT42_19025 [Salmonella enterica subsp. enterica serovar Manchester]|nr:hypothetical protein [Salmonella enterica subsp. enterica serovar Manchester]EBX3184536.1 hypothetical protein [Salmonella enterica subsp. enterica serovar Manchester]
MTCTAVMLAGKLFPSATLRAIGKYYLLKIAIFPHHKTISCGKRRLRFWCFLRALYIPIFENIFLPLPQ